jgi:choline dehydrogenase-like flavoprotein
MRRLISRMHRVVGPVQEVTTAGARVRLDPTVRDRLGVPVARLSGGLHPEDERAQAFLNDRCAEWLAASGASGIVRMPGRRPDHGPSGGQHQAGTARMGTDPAASVTDPSGRVWGHDNLWIADVSLHVTSGGVNHTIATTRTRSCPTAQTYIARRTAEGKTTEPTLMSGLFAPKPRT